MARSERPWGAPSDRRVWGYYIKKKRSQRGLRVGAVAARIGCGTSTLKHWEAQAEVPQPRYVPAIVNFIGFVPWARTPYQPTRGEAAGAARELQGLTQQGLAQRSGVSTWTISKLETNAGRVMSGMIERIEQTLMIWGVLNRYSNAPA